MVFGLLILAILMLFQLSKYSMVSGTLDVEIIVAIIAIVFFIVGVFINKKSLHKPVSPTTEIDHQKSEELDISFSGVRSASRNRFGIIQKRNCGQIIPFRKHHQNARFKSAGEAKCQTAYPSRTNCTRTQHTLKISTFRRKYERFGTLV